MAMQENVFIHFLNYNDEDKRIINEALQHDKVVDVVLDFISYDYQWLIDEQTKHKFFLLMTNFLSQISELEENYEEVIISLNKRYENEKNS